MIPKHRNSIGNAVVDTSKLNSYVRDGGDVQLTIDLRDEVQPGFSLVGKAAHDVAQIALDSIVAEPADVIAHSQNGLQGVDGHDLTGNRVSVLSHNGELEAVQVRFKDQQPPQAA